MSRDEGVTVGTEQRNHDRIGMVTDKKLLEHV
jgi:hypothetical protein